MHILSHMFWPMNGMDWVCLTTTLEACLPWVWPWTWACLDVPDCVRGDESVRGQMSAKEGGGERVWGEREKREMGSGWRERRGGRGRGDGRGKERLERGGWEGEGGVEEWGREAGREEGREEGKWGWGVWRRWIREGREGERGVKGRWAGSRAVWGMGGEMGEGWDWEGSGEEVGRAEGEGGGGQRGGGGGRKRKGWRMGLGGLGGQVVDRGHGGRQRKGRKLKGEGDAGWRGNGWGDGGWGSLKGWCKKGEIGKKRVQGKGAAISNGVNRIGLFSFDFAHALSPVHPTSPLYGLILSTLTPFSTFSISPPSSSLHPSSLPLPLPLSFFLLYLSYLPPISRSSSTPFLPPSPLPLLSICRSTTLSISLFSLPLPSSPTLPHSRSFAHSHFCPHVCTQTQRFRHTCRLIHNFIPPLNWANLNKVDDFLTRGNKFINH